MTMLLLALRFGSDVYRFWRRLEGLPTFMSHLERVTEASNGRSHWVAAGPAGLRVEWDAEITNEVENRLLAFQPESKTFGVTFRGYPGRPLQRAEECYQCRRRRHLNIAIGNFGG